MASDKLADTIVLSIETAARSGSLALLRGNEILAVWQGEETFSHSGELLVVIENLFQSAQINLSAINLFAVALGPGSFTGLRVGIATVKGFRAALQKPVCGVPTLAALAFGVTAPGAICTVFAAGRGEFFVQIFRNGKPQSQVMTVKLAELITKLNEFGNVAVVAAPEVQKQINELQAVNNKVIFVEPPENLAVNIGRIALQSNNDCGEFGSELKIIYGREPDAAKPATMR